MASGMLMGAGLGAATSLATGNDPLQGAAIGGAMGGIGGAMSSAPTTGAAASQQFAEAGMVNPALTGGAPTMAYTGPTSMMTNPGLTDAASSSMFGGLGDVASNAMDGFTDMTGYTGQDLGGMAFEKGVSALAQPQQQTQLNVPQSSISRPQFQPGMQGGGMLTSNPLMRKKQGLL